MEIIGEAVLFYGNTWQRKEDPAKKLDRKISIYYY